MRLLPVLLLVIPLLEALRSAFEACDDDGSGEIDAEELTECMSAMGEVVTIATAKEIIANLDKDGNGTLGFEEFVMMMTNGEGVPGEFPAAGAEAVAAGSPSFREKDADRLEREKKARERQQMQKERA